MSKPIYEIRDGNKWVRVKGTTAGLKIGWLHWSMRDGATGLARPGTWRERPGKAALREAGEE